MVSVSEKYRRSQKKKVIGMLEALIKKIRSGELEIVNHGWWVNNLSNGVFFKIDTRFGDSDGNPDDFRGFSS